MRQKLGQHFLINKDILQKIAGVLEARPEKIVVEIGPGHGELTDELILRLPSTGARIVLLERDTELAEDLRSKYRGEKRVEIIEGNALETLPRLASSLEAGEYSLFGNIPYYLTGYLMRTLSELGHKPALSVFTMQKEVAERICARPPEMNKLSAAVQFWADPKIIGFISRKDFLPPPEVDSATITLQTKASPAEESRRYYRALAALFKQPRKTIENNLSDALDLPKGEVSEKLRKAGIALGLRPQDLDVPDILRISSVIE